eukprot:5279240-Alexandrium_andersonii.AAC.1
MPPLLHRATPARPPVRALRAFSPVQGLKPTLGAFGPASGPSARFAPGPSAHFRGFKPSAAA